jgi:TetR/AcrR family transcriptional regulator, transcriptional repressor for nem operon
MPRVSKKVSDKHRDEIEQASARLFREHGLKGVSVADLMSSAGLTHGSFYCHFDSKDDLATIACSRSFEHSARQWAQMLSDGNNGPDAMASLINRYLRDANRTGPVADCAAATLAGDVAREPPDKPVRAAYSQGVEKLAAVLESQLASHSASPRRDSFALLSTLVGALMLSRATSGVAISKEIQSYVKDYLIALHCGLLTTKTQKLRSHTTEPPKANK